MQEDISDKIENFIEYIKNSVNCQCPAQVKTVNSNGTVNVIVFRNDAIDNQLLVGIKIKHLESSKAFIHLGTYVGDYGVIRYFDRSTDDYIEGVTDYNYDDRSHNTNDACFELGFIPNPSSYVYPSGEITIGSKTGDALITINEDDITIVGGNITITGNTKIDGKTFLSHVHSNGNEGANTGGVV